MRSTRCARLCARELDDPRQAPRRNVTSTRRSPSRRAARAEAEAAVDRARLSADGGAYTRLRVAAALDEVLRVRDDAPLAGWTLAVKDLIGVAGWRIGGGSRLLEGSRPERQDAPVVALLRRAGGIVVGATTLHELALGVTGVNDYTGTPTNPAAPGCIPGGSSSGSAVAVSEGSARVALATDTGGSSRIPAALCGVVGFKPAYGSYRMRSVVPLAPTMDHMGVMARSTDDIIRVHAVLRHAVPRRTGPPVVGVVAASLEAASAAVADRIEHALRGLAAAGCRLSDVSVADPETVLQHSSTIIFAEAAKTHAGARDRWETHVGADVHARLLAGSRISDAVYAAALDQRESLIRRVRAALAEVDVLLAPTVPILPPSLGDAGDPALPSRLVAETRLANLSGLPAISVPLGCGVGLQLVGRTDERLLGDAAWIERALDMGPSPMTDGPKTRLRAGRAAPSPSPSPSPMSRRPSREA